MTKTALGAILEIPGNASVFEALKQMVNDERAIAFVGAGASAGLYPTWGELINRLADHTVKEGKADSKDAERWKKDMSSTPQQRVNTIIRKLGDSSYRDFLKSTFAPSRGADGKRYTKIHSLILQLPFCGYVTTNYDPALEHARSELRSDSLSAGTPTWQDDNEVYCWRTGDIFKRDDCPMLWLHGYWQRPEGIVLNSGEYHEAYKPGIYKNTFRELWIRERMVFIGFGFNDPQFTFMIGEFLYDLGEANVTPRHIAILGWPVSEENSPIDAEDLKEKRESFEADFHLRVLFYPVYNNDHSALQIILENISALPLAVAQESVDKILPRSFVDPITTVNDEYISTITEYWVHETTNDDKFTGRHLEIECLNRWVKDQSVKIVAVSAVGGTGKTSLVGHWLQKTTGWNSRQFIGLFAWSFYQDRSSSQFILEFLKWSGKALGESGPRESIDHIENALRVLQKHSIVVVLDGLEVIQTGDDDISYGSFLDDSLRTFLGSYCQRNGSSLIVLTSRFVFADLERYLGTAFHLLELHGLQKGQGAKLLSELMIGGSDKDREQVSKALDGHPLALRVFADAIPSIQKNEPTGFLDEAFRTPGLAVGAPLNERLRRLLKFYEQRLPPVQVKILSVIALFRAPVPTSTVIGLIKGLFGNRESSILPDDTSLYAELETLHTRHILIRVPLQGTYGSACHPVLRDHFRDVLLQSGEANKAADLLKAQPAQNKILDFDELIPVLLAIELLLDAGSFEAAHELYHFRLDDGRIFRRIAANAEGLACALNFVKTEQRIQTCQASFSRTKLRSLINEVGLQGSIIGEHRRALWAFQYGGSMDRSDNSIPNLCTTLRNESQLLASVGRVTDAYSRAHEAVQIALKSFDKNLLHKAFAYRGAIFTLSGHLIDAAADFAKANEIEKQFETAPTGLHCLRGIWWSELLVKSRCPKLLELAFKQTHENLLICRSNDYQNDIGRCCWLSALIASEQGMIKDARSYLKEAEAIFRRGQMVLWLARVYALEAELYLKQGDGFMACERAEDALTIAASRSLKLIHVDTLNIRGRARFLIGGSSGILRGLDDADDALRIARSCVYPWGERDALALIDDIRNSNSNGLPHQGRTFSSEATHFASYNTSEKLVLSMDDFEKSEAAAQKWLKNLRIKVQTS